jgi:hypothetical protein
MGGYRVSVRLILTASVLASVIVIACSSQASRAEAASGPKSGTYAMKRPTIEVKFVVRHHEIVYVQVGAVSRCANGESFPYGLGFTFQGSLRHPALRSGPAGRFNFNEEDEGHTGLEGGQGEEPGEKILAGRIEGNTVKGRFFEWEESFSEEEQEEGEEEPPRCGTGSSKGRTMYFTAHRVS